MLFYEVASGQPIVRMVIDLIGDGENGLEYSFGVGPGFDGRYNRLLGPKFTVNGTWPLSVTAWDSLGRHSTTVCTPGITVVF